VRYVLLSDLHLDSNALGEYKWEWLHLFSIWLKNYGNVHRDKTTLIILGDITENKDRHTSQLVNRFIDHLNKWRASVSQIFILTGNHDGVDVVRPFFRFVTSVSKVAMVITPEMIDIDGDRCLFLPNSKNPIESWEHVDFSNMKYIFMHQAVNGAKTANDYDMTDALPLDYFSKTRAMIFSGDIHVPQTLGNLTYVGSPYPIYFGDDFKGRFISINERSSKSTHLPSIRKLKLNISSVMELKKIDIQEDDQLNIEYHLESAEQHRWVDIRDKIRSHINSAKATIVSLELIVPRSDISLKGMRRRLNHTTTDEEYIRSYSKKNKLDSFFIETAIDILNNVKESN
jgi:calcineurin-like phosphoesterase family protein